MLSNASTQIEGIEMMGRQEVAQAPLFYSFNLDTHIPANHLLRGIDRFLDLSELHQHLAPHYSNTGRPSIDPALLIRMLVVGYCFGIRSERQLCEEVQLNLAYRWFCRLGLEDEVPDHSTFSKNRHGQFRDNDTLPEVRVRKGTGTMFGRKLVGGEGFASRRKRGQGRRQPATWCTRRRKWHSIGPPPWRDPCASVSRRAGCGRRTHHAAQERIAHGPCPARWTRCTRRPGVLHALKSTNYLIDAEDWRDR